MLRTLARTAQHVRRPMIKFPDRKSAQEPAKPHPHPAAPKQIADDFEHFQETFRSGPHFHPEKLQSLEESSEQARSQFGTPHHQPGEGSVNQGIGSSSKTSAPSRLAKGDVAEDLHDLPERFWKRPSSTISEAEMDAIMSGGASQVPS